MSYLIALIVVLLDQYTKALAISKLRAGTVPVLKDVFHFTYVENTGAAFGMFKNANTFFMIVIPVIIAGIVAALFKLKPKSKLVKISAGMIIGGAAGNLIDRIVHGFVVDFLDFRLIDFPVFNLADSMIVIGAILISIYVIFFENKEEKRDAQA